MDYLRNILYCNFCDLSVLRYEANVDIVQKTEFRSNLGVTWEDLHYTDLY